MQRRLIILLGVTLLLIPLCLAIAEPKEEPLEEVHFRLGNEVLMDKFRHLLVGQKVGLITNQSGVNCQGKSTIAVLAEDPEIQLVALYGPEHGLDGQAAAGAYVESYFHPELGIPVYSLYGPTRRPTEEMLADVDLLLYDIQDIGARTYTYISTLRYCQEEAQKYGKKLIVLDRPNPLGGEIVDGAVLEEPFRTFVGVDLLPTAHGMTVGELALYFNRNIGADLQVIPLEGYRRHMIYQETNLPWIATSPNIPDIDAVFGYMATGLGEGTGIFQADQFKWIGGQGIEAKEFADLLNGAGLPGVTFIAEERGSAGGVRLKITDYHTFNPAKSGIYALAYARLLNNFKVPKSSAKEVVMFDKIMGTDQIGRYLEQNLTPQQIEAKYLPGVQSFREERQQYLLYDDSLSRVIAVYVQGQRVLFDVEPFIDENNRTLVPLRAIGEALGAQIDWEEASRTVRFTKEEEDVLFMIDRPEVIVQGEMQMMDTTPIIKESRTLLPLRYVGQFLGAEVVWDNATSTITIN